VRLRSRMTRPARASRRCAARWLVHVMERHGFSWGGRWPTVPDGMHFEFHGDGPPAVDKPL